MQMKKTLGFALAAGSAAQARAFVGPGIARYALCNALARPLSTRRSALDFPLSRALGASSPLAPLDLFSFFEDLDFPVQTAVSPSQQHRMLMDVKETPNTYELMVDLPGVETKDVDIKLRGRDLIINAHREMTKKEDNEQFHRVERRSGRVHRMLTLPDNADENSIEAVSKNGVLHVTIKKTTQEPKLEAKKIEIKQLP